jgi:hypothetical protein
MKKLVFFFAISLLNIFAPELANAQTERPPSQMITVFNGVTGKNKALGAAENGAGVGLFLPADMNNWDTPKAKRQLWEMPSLNKPNKLAFNIIVLGGVEGVDKYLSANEDGTIVDLWGEDDGSGRQKWEFIPVKSDGSGDEGFYIVVMGGVSGGRKYLSVSPDGKKIELSPIDDKSGRQRWTLE